MLLAPCDSLLSNWSCFSAHSWTKSFSSSLLHLSWAFLFSTDADAQHKKDGVDAGIELSFLTWRDSGNESVLVVGIGWDFLDHQTCKGLAKDRSIPVDIVDIRTEKIGRPRRDENVSNFTTKSIAWRLCYVSPVKSFPN